MPVTTDPTSASCAYFQMKQELWATDLDLKYSNMVSMHQLLEFMTGGSFDQRSHLFSVTPLKQEEKKRRRRGTTEIEVDFLHSALYVHLNNAA